MRHGNEVAMEDLFAEEFNLEQMEAETEAMLALNYLDRSNIAEVDRSDPVHCRFGE